MNPQLVAHDLARAFNGVHAVDGVSFEVAQGETLSIIGPNGAGKTTLFNLLSGLDQPTRGSITLDGQPLAALGADRFAALGVARTFQHGRVFGNLSVLDNVLIGAHARRRLAHIGSTPLAILAELAAGLVRPGFVAAEERAFRAEAESILALFGDRLLPRLHEPAHSLSYANRRRVELARALAARPRVLLLDEPTAGMNLTETAEALAFIQRLQDRRLTILLIEHKLSLVMTLSDRVLVMDDGRVIAAGVPETVRTNPQVIEAYLGHARRTPPEAEDGATRAGPADPFAAWNVPVVNP